jgi:hypothetical protein
VCDQLMLSIASHAVHIEMMLLYTCGILVWLPLRITTEKKGNKVCDLLMLSITSHAVHIEMMFALPVSLKGVRGCSGRDVM